MRNAERLPGEVFASELARIRCKWPSMPKVTVVKDPSEIPVEVSNTKWDGYYRHGYRDVFLVAGNIASVAQLRKVMAHECIFHYSLEEMLGNYGFSKLQSALQASKREGDPIVCALAADISTRYGPLSEREETMEMIAAAGERFLDCTGEVQVKYGFMKGVYAGVASWLRDHGLPVPFTNAELQGIIHDAAEWVKSIDRERPSHICGVGALMGAVVITGEHSGKVVSALDGYVVQKIGRHDKFVWHEQSRLSRRVEEGDVIDILYENGQGIVQQKERVLER